MNWEDLRYILAVAREGTIVAAAESLAVSPTTMSRRLRALEETQGTALFDKLKHGVVLTGAGERTVEVAKSVEALTHQLDAEIHGLDHKLEGSIRVTSTEMLVRHFLPDLRAFTAKYPHVELAMDSRTSLANMTQREADVAIRLGQTAPEHLVGRSYGTVAFAVFGHRQLVASVGASAGYERYPWVGWDTGPKRATDAWLETHAPGAKVAMRFASMPAMGHAVEAGVGLGVLPCLVGDGHPHLLRVGDYLSLEGPKIWLLTHPQLRGAARIRVLMAALREALERDRDLLEGRRPQAHFRGSNL